LTAKELWAVSVALLVCFIAIGALAFQSFNLASEVSSLRQSVARDVESLKGDVGSLRGDISSLAKDVKSISDWLKKPPETRAVFKRGLYALRPGSLPASFLGEGFMTSALPNLKDCVCKVCITDDIAGFSNYIIEVKPGGGTISPVTENLECWLYAIDGSATLVVGDKTLTLTAGDFVFIPPATTYSLKNTFTASFTFISLKKVYLPTGFGTPTFVYGNEKDIVATPFPPAIAKDVAAKILISGPAYDGVFWSASIAVGGGLVVTETHPEKHGILWVSGDGAYLLGEQWYPLKAGDYIWIESFTPHSVKNLGTTPCKYLMWKINAF